VEKMYVSELKTMIHEYGVHETLQSFIEALESCADQYSDQGLKERAYEAAEAAELLSGIKDVVGAGSPDLTADIV
jgi:hypothetical protein